MPLRRRIHHRSNKSDSPSVCNVVRREPMLLTAHPGTWLRDSPVRSPAEARVCTFLPQIMLWREQERVTACPNPASSAKSKRSDWEPLSLNFRALGRAQEIQN